MKLEVGMYVITTDRKQIGKIIGFCQCEMCKERGFCEPVIDNPEIFITISDKERKFHGYKFYDTIMDLLEVGDYVNGYKVINVGVEELGHTYLSLDMNENIHWLESEIENEEQIKSIVTKENFESMSYKVGE